MRNEVYAIEYLDNVPLRVHVFHLEEASAKSDYRAIVSCNAFDTFMCKECLRDINARRFWVHRKHSWEHLVDSDRRGMLSKHNLPPFWVNLPKQFHKSIWSFYQSVGYDYKRKRFIEQPTISAAQSN